MMAAITLRRFRLAAFSGFLLLVAASVIVTFAALQTQRQDALVINLAGRQRMLIQTMALQVLGVQVGSNPTYRDSLHDTAHVYFEQTLHALMEGGEAPYADGKTATLPATRDPEIRAQLESVHAAWDELHPALMGVLEEDPAGPDFADSAATVERLAPVLLSQMDQAVLMYEAEATHKVARVQAIQIGFLATTTALLLAALFVTERWVLGPIARLGAAVQRLGQGDLDTPVSVAGLGEIARLTHSFDAMRTGLQNSYTQLEARNRRLRRLYELAITLDGSATELANQVVAIVAELLDARVVTVQEVHGDKTIALSMYDHGQIVNQGEFPLRGTPCENVCKEKKTCHYTRAVELFPDDPFLAEYRLNTYLGVPILDGQGEVLGVVNAMDDRERDFDEEDIHLLQTLAKRVSLELEQSRAEAELRRRAGELQAIAEVGGLVTAGDNLQTTLDTLARKIGEAAGFDIVSISLYDAEKEEMTFSALFTTHPIESLETRKGTTTRLEETPALQQLLHDQHYLLFEDPQHDPRVGEGQRTQAREDDIQTVLSWPLLFTGKLIGRLDLYSIQPRNFAPEDLSLLSTLADQTATAVQNARLSVKTQQQLREISLLFDLSAALRTMLHTYEMLPAILDHVTTALNAAGAAIFALDAETGKLAIKAAHGERASMVGESRLLAAMPADCAMRAGAVCFGQDNCPFFPKSGHPLKVACVTLGVGEHILGGLHVGTRRSAGFSADEIRLLEGVADIAANALRRGELFEEVRLYKDAFEATVDAMMLTDLQARIFDVNPAFERVTGYSRAEALGQKPSLLKSKHSTPEFYQAMWDQILDQGAWSGEIINLRKNGREWDAHLTISTVKDERNQPVAYLGINRDITELKDLQREREALYQAERQQRELAETLREAAVALSATLDFDTLLDFLLEQIARVVPFDAAVVMLADPPIPLSAEGVGRARVHIARQRGFEQFGEHVVRDIAALSLEVASTPNLRRMAETGQSLVVPDTAVEPTWVTLEASAHVRSWVGAPIVTEGEVIAFFSLDKIESDFYQPEHARRVAAFAGQAALSLQNARLFAAEQDRRQELDALYELARQLVANDEIDMVLDSVVRRAVETVHVAFGHVLLLRAEDELICRAGCTLRAGNPELPLKVEEQPPEETRAVFREVLRRRQPWVLQRSDGLRLNDLPELAPGLTGAIAATLRRLGANLLCLAPLRVGEEPVGVLLLGETRSFEREPFSADKVRLTTAIADQASSALHRARLHEELEKSYLEAVLALAKAMDARDTYTGDHSQRLARWAEATARQFGCSEEEIATMRWGALLHDIGKIGVPDAILRKPGKLDEEEWEVMKRHPEIGAEIVAPVRKLARVSPIIRAHQEKYDGSGYPDGLKGEAIPLGARILAVVDAYSAITDERPYKKARSGDEAVAELRRCAGAQFDPQVVEVFLQMREDLR